MYPLIRLPQLHQKIPQLLTMVKNIFSILKCMEWFCQNITVFICFLYPRIFEAAQKWQVKAKQDSFWWYMKYCKGFSKIDDCVNSDLQKSIFISPTCYSYPHFYWFYPSKSWWQKCRNKDRGTQVSSFASFSPLYSHKHAKEILCWFYVSYDEKGLVHISYFDLRLLLPPQ